MFRLFHLGFRHFPFMAVAMAMNAFAQAACAQSPATQPGAAPPPGVQYKADADKWQKIVGDQSGLRDPSAHARLREQLIPLHQEMARLRDEMAKKMAQLRPATQPTDPAIAEAVLLPWQEAELIAAGDAATIADVKSQASSTNARLARIGQFKMLVGQWLAGPDETAQNKTADQLTEFLKTGDLNDRSFNHALSELLFFGRGATDAASDHFYAAFKTAFPGAQMELEADNAQVDVVNQQWRNLVGDGTALRDPATRARLRVQLPPLDQKMTSLTKQIATDRAILRPAPVVARMANQDARLAAQRQCVLIVAGDEPTIANAKSEASSTDPKLAVIGQIKLLAGHWLTDSDEAAQNKTADKMTALLKSADVKDQTAVNNVLAIFGFEGVTPAAQDYWQHAIAAGFPYAAIASRMKAVDAKKQIAQSSPENNPIALAGTTVDGKPFSTADWKGKVILVDFWASWCGPCKAELPHVKKMYRTYHDKGFEVLGVDNDYTKAALQKYLAKDTEMVWPNLFDEASASQQGWNSLTSKYGITGIPVMFLIDRNGILRTMNARENMDELIPKLLGENITASATPTTAASAGPNSTATPAEDQAEPPAAAGIHAPEPAAVAASLSTLSPAPMPTAAPTTMPAETWQMRKILPSDTDSKISQYSGDGWMHCIYVNPDVPRKNQLLVFLNGTAGKGPAPKWFAACAADLGFDVVSLAYPSLVSMSDLNDSDDPDAFTKARNDIIYGTAPYAIVTVDRENCIENRLVKLVEYLANKYPREGWGQYLDGKGSMLWSKLILAGQSQGGGHAPFIAKQHEVARVLMFASPKDFNINSNQPGKWLSDPSVTPIDRYFSFVHVDDGENGCTYPEQLENYHAMGLMPKYAVVDVDNTPYPYTHTRLLSASHPAPRPHGAPIGDPAYKQVWIYMLTEPTGNDG